MTTTDKKMMQEFFAIPMLKEVSLSLNGIEGIACRSTALMNSDALSEEQIKIRLLDTLKLFSISLDMCIKDMERVTEEDIELEYIVEESIKSLHNLKTVAKTALTRDMDLQTVYAYVCVITDNLFYILKELKEHDYGKSEPKA